MWYKGTKTECENYNNTVTTGENYSGTTTKWAEPIEINGSFYINKHADYTASMEEVSELPQMAE